MLLPLTLVAGYQWNPPPACASDWRSLFHDLFLALPAELTILPSENVLYLRFVSGGLTFQGCLSVRLRARRTPTLTFSYCPVDPSLTEPGCYRQLQPEDGITLEQLSRFHYRAQGYGRSVSIQLQTLRLSPPSRCRLRQDESFVGPSCDESGLYFSLLFDSGRRAFVWILDDDETVPETFVRVGRNLLLGERTRFAFFDDQHQRRLCLVGVSQAEARANTWYDGPFDQLPDNYIDAGEVEIRSYIERANPDRRGQIDKFGYFHMLHGSRVAIAPYLLYHSRADLAAIDDYITECGMAPPGPTV